MEVKCRLANVIRLLLAGPEVIKITAYSTQLSMKFSLLINVKMPTNWYFNIYEQTNNILVFSEHENPEFLDIFILLKFHVQLS